MELITGHQKPPQKDRVSIKDNLGNSHRACYSRLFRNAGVSPCR